MSKFYLVVLEEDGVEMKDIIHNPSEIKKFIEEYERKKFSSTRKAKGSSKEK